MREMIFRGRDALKRWHYGDMIQHSGDIDLALILETTTTGLQLHAVSAQTLGMYTGIPDIKARSIYEGDIVTCGDDPVPSVVRWDDKRACFVIVHSLILGDVCKFVRVIGNIHDDPELLEALNA